MKTISKSDPMNILVIGNGFDLAHNLPTRYADFLYFCQEIHDAYIKYDLPDKNNQFQGKWQSFWYNFLLLLYKHCGEEVVEKLTDCLKTKNPVNINDNLIVSPDETLELCALINNNVWIDYFKKLYKDNKLGENWIDFEKEISNVIMALSEVKMSYIHESTVLDDKNKQIYTRINRRIKKFYPEVSSKDKSNMSTVDSLDSLSKKVSILKNDLDRLIRALEIYLAVIVERIEIPQKIPEIENLKVDYLISFNYTTTYEKIYGNVPNVNYIHGKADKNKNIKTSNLVLGMDDKVQLNGENLSLEFFPFMKFFQKIYKETDSMYLDWIDDIKNEYNQYLIDQETTLSSFKELLQVNNAPVEEYFEMIDLKEKYNEKPMIYNLYIFGHSLDETDKEVLKKLICNNNVKSTIYYYREDAEDKKVFGSQITNLVKVIGYEELMRRVGGRSKTIKFVGQQV